MTRVAKFQGAGGLCEKRVRKKNRGGMGREFSRSSKGPQRGARDLLSSPVPETKPGVIEAWIGGFYLRYCKMLAPSGQDQKLSEAGMLNSCSF